MNLPVRSADILPAGYWHIVGKAERDAASLADRHYSRRKIGSPQFMPPGQTMVMLGLMHDAVFGWWRPHPRSGIKAMNGLDGWTCSIFRNESQQLSSELVLQAESHLRAMHDCGPDGMLTYVWDKKVVRDKGYRKLPQPGHCFLMAGWIPIGRSADKRKTLLWKSFGLAGLRACSAHHRSPA